jgi:hypothetical protein
VDWPVFRLRTRAHACQTGPGRTTDQRTFEMAVPRSWEPPSDRLGIHPPPQVADRQRCQRVLGEEFYVGRLMLRWFLDVRYIVVGAGYERWIERGRGKDEQREVPLPKKAAGDRSRISSCLIGLVVDFPQTPA